MPSKQVPTLELCNKLKELGYPQEGLFFWGYKLDGYETNKENKYVYLNNKENRDWCEFEYVAPTVSEMGECLGENTLWDIRSGQYSDKNDYVCYTDRGTQQFHSEREGTEANARAKCLIWLVENKYLSFKEVTTNAK